MKKRLLCLALALILVLTATSALASQGEFEEQSVMWTFPGDSYETEANYVTGGKFAEDG